MKGIIKLFKRLRFKSNLRLCVILSSALLAIIILAFIISSVWPETTRNKIADISNNSTIPSSNSSQASTHSENLKPSPNNSAGNSTTQVNGSLPTLTIAAFDSPSVESADYVCDGQNDQVEIQDALDKLDIIGGGKLLFLSGTYLLSPDESGNICLSLPGNITLEGLGTSREDVRLISKGNPEESIFQTRRYSYNPPWETTSGIKIQNLTIDIGDPVGSPRPWYAGFTGNDLHVIEATSNDIVLNNIKFIHTGTQSVAQIYLNHCDNVTITGSLFDGLIIYSSANGTESGQKHTLINQGKFNFQDNQVINFPRIGLYVDMNNVLLEGNTFNNGAYTAVDIGQSSNAIIENNQFNNVAHQAIYSEGGHDINIRNNQIEDIRVHAEQTDGWAIHLSDLRSLRAGSRIFIEDNSCQNCAQGILSEGVQNVVIRNNTLNHIEGSGISISALNAGEDGNPSFADNCQVYDNIIE